MTIQELEQTIEIYGKSIYSFCLQLTRNTSAADDLYQETWLVACKKAAKIRKQDNVKSYLISVTIGVWRNQKRKNAWRNRIAPQESLLEGTIADTRESMQDALARYLDEEKAQMVKDAVNRLDEKYKLPVLLFYMEEMSVKEIAMTLKISEGTVKSRLSYARAHLEKDLGGYIDE